MSKEEHGPPPLRSESEPLGITSVLAARPLDKLRVETANILYSLCAQVLLFCEGKDIAWCVENPSNSLFWWRPEMMMAVQQTRVQQTNLQNCAYGGERPKWTCLLHSPAHLFTSLGARCSGISDTHHHAPWEKQSHSFSTALEAVYPDGLCAGIVRQVMLHLDLQQQPPLELIRARGETQDKRERPERLAAARQPRGARGRKLLSEFSSVLTLKHSFRGSDPRTRPGHVWQEEVIAGQKVPKGSKTIRAWFKGEAGAAREGSFDPSL